MTTRRPDPADGGAGERSPAARWGWRIGVVAAAAVYAVAAFGSGTDRMARYDPRLAVVVPGPFRANADRAVAQVALAASNWKLMEAAGADAVRRDPLNNSSAALYGWALFNQRKEEPATAAFKVAGQLGWRDPLTQIYWFAAAMQQEDYAVAAMRMDALLRQNPWDPRRDAALFQLENIPAGRAALIEQMKERPGWLVAYASGVQPLPSNVIDARSQTLLELGRSGTRLGCDGIAGFVNRLVDMQRLGAAQALRAAHCGDAGRGLLTDASFAAAQVQRPLTPFDWDIASDGSLDLTLLDDGKGRSLRVSNSGAATRPFATQLLATGPGRFTLSGRIVAEEGGNPSHFGVALTCAKGGVRQEFSGIAIAGDRFSVPVTIPAQCPMPWLSLTVSPGRGYVTVSSLSLVRD